MSDVRRIGLTELYRPSEEVAHELDIVFVHGLHGHPKNTWTCNVTSNRPTWLEDHDQDEDKMDHARRRERIRQKETSHEVFWPQSLLPVEFPNSRILTWGYDVDVQQIFKATSKASIFQHAGSLLSDLATFRGRITDQHIPIVFVSHSLGGIVVKDALCQSRNETDEYLNSILLATQGVMFLGCPHRGSNIASLGKIASEISRLAFQNPNVKLLRGLEVDSEILERIAKEFGQILESERLNVHSFQEELDTNGAMIVSTSSSAIGHPKETRGTLHANHRNMAKISSITDVKFIRIVSMVHKWKKKWEKQNEKLYNAVVQSLNFPEARTRVEMVEPAYKETYQWLFDPGIGFTKWISGEHANPRFWIQGKPGSGKSTAMKFVMSHQETRRLLKTYNRNDWVVAGYFFHDRGSGVQKSILGFLREILYQVLCQRKYFPCIQKIFSTLDLVITPKQNLVDYWNVSTLQKALHIIAQYSSTDVNICLFVDALDEHEGSHRDLLLVLNGLVQLPDNPSFRLRLCLAGRPENVFRDALESCPGLNIHMHTTKDIQIYARGRITKERAVRLTDEGEEDLSTLTDSIIRAAQGVFMWVRLVVDELIDRMMDGESLEELNTVLLSIPTELEDLYERSLRRPYLAGRRALPKYKYEAYVMFQVATCSQRPFTLTEFIASTLFLTMDKSATGIMKSYSSDQMQRRLYARSTGLLEAAWVPSRAEQVVQFVHQTVKDFVVAGKGRSIIGEGIPGKLQQSGHLLIFRYLTHEILIEPSLGHCQPSQVHEFCYHALLLEHEESFCLHKLLEPALILEDREHFRKELFRLWICGYRNTESDWGDEPFWETQPPWEVFTGLYLRYPQIQLLLFYVYLSLPLSAIEAFASVKDNMNELEISAMIETTLISQLQDLSFEDQAQLIHSRVARLEQAQYEADSSPTWFLDLDRLMQKDGWFDTNQTAFSPASKATLAYCALQRTAISKFAEKARALHAFE